MSKKNQVLFFNIYICSLIVLSFILILLKLFIINKLTPTIFKEKHLKTKILTKKSNLLDLNQSNLNPLIDNCNSNIYNSSNFNHRQYGGFFNRMKNRFPGVKGYMNPGSMRKTSSYNKTGIKAGNTNQSIIKNGFGSTKKRSSDHLSAYNNNSQKSLYNKYTGEKSRISTNRTGIKTGNSHFTTTRNAHGLSSSSSKSNFSMTNKSSSSNKSIRWK